MDTLIFEIGLAIALITIVGLVSNKLRFSVIPFYILIGMAVGPHAPHFGVIDLRFIESGVFIDFMGRIGVLFLLFYLGLEFSVSRLLKSGKSIVVGGLCYIGINFVSGLLLGWLMGFPLKETMVICGIMTSSSTAIVAKVLVDLKRTANPETEIIMGMIMFDDLFIAVHISILSGLVLSGDSSFWSVLLTSLSALIFILLFLFIGRRFIPFIDKGLNIKSAELFLLVIISALFLTAGFSETFHVAEAIGALMVGMVLAESSHVKRIEHYILPFRDLFGAIFFFSFGLTIDPTSLFGAVWVASAYDYRKYAARLYRGTRGRHFRACLDEHRLYACVQGRILNHYGQYRENGRTAARRSVVRRTVCAHIGCLGPVTDQGVRANIRIVRQAAAAAEAQAEAAA
ncbi:hypothetical protein J6TS7_28500 [Paenibacillus dendritiformis]|nr:hypothetical protein J6TS7_28500 [Paenibacillus dendritiformis]